MSTANKINWQDTALRLQAEMDNFRKRQQRRADQTISTEQERLLTIFLPIIDNLERALAHQDEAHQDEGDKTVRQGVELTRRELMRLLEGEGVTRLKTIGHLFDPKWHEAITTMPAPDTIVEEVEAGYKLGDKLLRPARVVVAA
jgi:molecular chaperone GrpE